jgi:hypothetical protein
MSQAQPSTGNARGRPPRRFQAPRPDFLRPVARPGTLAWAWCATGVLVLAAAALDGHATWQDRSRAQAQLVASRSAATRLAPAPAAPRPEQRAREAEARRWLQQLALPWPAVWAGAELAADGVTWVAMAVRQDGTAAGLRLTGTAATLAPAEATAQALRQQQRDGRPVWQQVALASVERTPEGLRFELVTQLARPAGAAADAP